MKKGIMSLVLAVSLVLCSAGAAADQRAAPSDDAFLEFYAGGSAVWESNMNEGVDRWATSCGLYVRPYAENIATVTLKPNTTYVFNACYRNLDSGTKAVFYDGAYGFAISTADYTGTNIADNCLNKGTFNTSVPEGQTYGYIVDQTFTTTDATEYKFRFGFAPTSAGGRIVLENCTLKELSEEEETGWTVYEYGSGVLESAKVSEWAYVEQSTEKDHGGDGKSLKFHAASQYATLPLSVEKNTDYELSLWYYSDQAVIDYLNSNFIVNEAAVMIPGASFSDSVSGKLCKSSFYESFVTENGDESTVIKSTTANLTALPEEGLKGQWHQLTLRFNSGDFESLYFYIMFPSHEGQMVSDAYVDDIELEIYEGGDGSLNDASIWKVYEFGSDNMQTGSISTWAGVSESTALDNDGDGRSLKFNAQSQNAVAGFDVEPNTDYTITYNYYSQYGISNYLEKNFIINCTAVMGENAGFGYDDKQDKLVFSGFSMSYTTAGGDASTADVSYTKNLTALEEGTMRGNWHTVTLTFNSSDYERLYLWIVPAGINGQAVSELFVDSIELKEIIDVNKPNSWRAYDADALGLDDAPSSNLSVTLNTEADFVRDGDDSIMLNTAGGHAVVPFETAADTDYILVYYYKSEGEGIKIKQSAVLAPSSGFDSPISLSDTDFSRVRQGGWNRVDISFNSGDNTTVYLDIVLLDSAGAVFVDSFSLKRKEGSQDLNRAENWEVYEYGTPNILDGKKSGWATVQDTADKKYDRDGDGHALVFNSPSQNAVVPFAVEKNTWYRLTYSYYSDEAVYGWYNKNFIIERTQVMTDEAVFNYDITDGVFAMIGYTTAYSAKGGDGSIAMIDLSRTSALSDVKEEVTGRWHDIELIFYSGDHENVYLNIVFANFSDYMVNRAYVDNIELSKASAALTNVDTNENYCEWVHNKLRNFGFESESTASDWGDPLPSGMKIIAGSAAQQDRYLVVAGTKVVYPIKLKEMTEYTLGLSIRGSAGVNGFVGIALDAAGQNMIADYEGVNYGTIPADSTSWTRSGFDFRSSSDGILYLVFAAAYGNLEVDNICLFEKGYGLTEDINDYTVYKDFDFDNIDPSIMITNGGFESDYNPGADPGMGSTALYIKYAALTAAVSFLAVLCCYRRKRRVSA